jgi:prepilin-type N-terminal cleavage/methylation domain-containing protein
MVASMIRRRGTSRTPAQAQSGFSLIEVVISMAILSVGLVSLLGVFGLAMASTQTSQQDLIAKQLANEALESIVTARNTSQIAWDDIQNTGSTCADGSSGCGIFANGAQPIYQGIATGASSACSKYLGILGTTCDVGQPVQTLTEPGPDGIYGTTDDVSVPLTGYQRTILISQVTDSNGVVQGSLRAVNVTVQYQTAQMRVGKSYILSTLISSYQ